ncbi:MAG TPA: hypothetical protein PLR28_13610 [Dokdonella sp.]|uniref:hypothetical protein n=1 Tax=Dokdonella sp. TaxID=2291710 RepID=UPI002CA28F7A|nr:hypothetical protein [Dokdonella sp.]HOX71703.1 hypothetical protein [Dokdonella sp.]HPG95585.1 hypothetical protein [Dokdonella sp.]HPN78736.1 hypothetical protein [Dokdonella sp.]
MASRLHVHAVNTPVPAAIPMKKKPEYIPARRNEPESDTDLASRISRHLLDLLGRVPSTDEKRSSNTEVRVRALTTAAANKAALAAGTLALPPGPLGWLTIVPELVAIWRIQAQLVADLSGVYGVNARLNREQMMYCLFRHAAAQAVRDLVVQIGGRLIAQDVPVRVIERVAHAIGLRVTKRLVGGGISRWLPVIGAVGVGAYAWYDTRQVARTAIRLFGGGPTTVDAVLDAMDEEDARAAKHADAIEHVDAAEQARRRA